MNTIFEVKLAQPSFMPYKKIVAASIFLLIAWQGLAQAPTRKFEPVNFSQVTITDNFWSVLAQGLAKRSVEK